MADNNTSFNAGSYSGLFGSLIGGAFNMGGLALANRYQKQNTQEQRDYELKLYERQLADQKELWRMNNEYNSPVEQMKRLALAGINPAEQFGSGDIVGNSASGLDTPSMTSAPSLGLPGSEVGKAFASTAEIATQTALLMAQIKNLNSNTNKTEADTKLTEQKIVSQINENSVFDEVTKAKLNQIVASTEYTLKQKDALVLQVQSQVELNNAKIEELAQRVIALKDEHDFVPYKQQQYLLDFEVKRASIREIESACAKTSQEIRNLSVAEQTSLFELQYLKPLEQQMYALGLDEKQVKIEMDKVALQLEQKNLKYAGAVKVSEIVRNYAVGVGAVAAGAGQVVSNLIPGIKALQGVKFGTSPIIGPMN